MGLSATCFPRNGVTTELLPPVTRLRRNGFARNVFSLERHACRMASHFEWSYEVDLRCAPHGPRLESNSERKSFLGPCFVLISRVIPVQKHYEIVSKHVIFTTFLCFQGLAHVRISFSNILRGSWPCSAPNLFKQNPTKILCVGAFRSPISNTRRRFWQRVLSKHFK